MNASNASKNERIDVLLRAMRTNLANSSVEMRHLWVRQIVDEAISIRHFESLLDLDKRAISRLLWLFSEIGLESAKKLHQELPVIYALLKKLDAEFLQALANYWLIAGVPEEQEANAIGLLFEWLQSPKTRVSIKSRAVYVLFELCKRHPDLKSEFIFCLLEQRDRNSADFAKKVDKLLRNLKVTA